MIRRKLTTPLLFRLMALVILVLLASRLDLPSAEAQVPTTNTISLSVLSARTEPRAFDGAGVLIGDPVAQFQGDRFKGTEREVLSMFFIDMICQQL